MGFISDDLTKKTADSSVDKSAETSSENLTSDNGASASSESGASPQAESTDVTQPQTPPGNANSVSDSIKQQQQATEEAFNSGLIDVQGGESVVQNPTPPSGDSSAAQAVAAPSPDAGVQGVSFTQQPSEKDAEVKPEQGISIDWSKPYSEIEQNPLLLQMKPYDIMRDFEKNGNGDWVSFMPWLKSLGDVDKTVAANAALQKKAERQAKWEQLGNLFLHVGNFFGTTMGAPSQKIESAKDLTERQRKLREGTDALRQKGYDQMMVNIWKDRQNKQAQMQAEAAAKANDALAAYRGSQKAQVDALTPVKVDEVTQSARQHSTGADLNVSKKETEDALRGKKGKLLDAQTNNANAGADDKRSHIGVNNSTIAKNNAQTQKTNRENADNKEADDFNYNYVNDPTFKKYVNQWATHNGMAIGGNEGTGGTWSNKYNREQASKWAKAQMKRDRTPPSKRPNNGGGNKVPPSRRTGAGGGSKVPPSRRK